MPDSIDHHRWKDNAVTRNFNIILLNGTNYPVADVNLSLQSLNKTLGWNRVTDDFGKASFNLTFTDTNYTDGLRLEAVKSNYSALIDIDFLSITPVVLKMRHYIDLNGDGVVNIVDISIAAKAFGSKLGDSNWNQTADLNKEGAVNIDRSIGKRLRKNCLVHNRISPKPFDRSIARMNDPIVCFQLVIDRSL